MGALLGVCQISFPSLLAIGPGLLGVQITGGRIQQIDHLFYQLPGVVQQPDIRRIMNICRTAGRVKNQRSTVLSFFCRLCRESVLTVFLIYGIIFFGVIHAGNCFWRKNQIVDPLNHLRRNTLPEMCHHGCVEGRVHGVALKSAEVLQIRVLLDISSGLFICVAFLGLDIQCPEGQTRWNGHLALTALEMFLILPVNLFPRELLAEDYPPVILTQCDPKGHLHLKLVIIFVPIHLHHLQTFSFKLLNPFADILPHYPCFS